MKKENIKTFKNFLSEGIRMGTRDIMNIQGNYTFGFELEIALPDLSNEGGSSSSQSIQQLAYSIAESVFENAVDLMGSGDMYDRIRDYYESNSNIDDFQEWIEDQDNFLKNFNIIEDILTEFLVPKYGWAEENSDPEKWTLFTSEDQEETIAVEEILDFADVVEYFEGTAEAIAVEFEQNLEEEYEEFYREKMMENKYLWVDSHWQDYISQAREDVYDVGGSDDEAFSYVENKFEDVLSRMTLTYDQSAGVDVEIVSDIYDDLEFGLTELGDALDLISEDEEIETNGGTGIHINIGTWSEEELKKVDWLKFLVIHGTDRVLKSFARETNPMTSSKLPEIIYRYIEILEDGDYIYGPQDTLSEDDQEKLRMMIMEISLKFSAFNLSKLNQHGYIEFRGMGNRGYEEKKDEIIFEIRKILKSLEIASDPNAYRKEYIKKLYTLVKDRGFKADDPLALFYYEHDLHIPPIEERRKPRSPYDPLKILLYFIDIVSSYDKRDYKSALNRFNRKAAEVLVEDMESASIRGGVFDRIDDKMKLLNPKDMNYKEMRDIFYSSVMGKYLKRAFR